MGAASSAPRRDPTRPVVTFEGAEYEVQYMSSNGSLDLRSLKTGDVLYAVPKATVAFATTTLQLRDEAAGLPAQRFRALKRAVSASSAFKSAGEAHAQKRATAARKAAAKAESAAREKKARKKKAATKEAAYAPAKATQTAPDPPVGNEDEARRRVEEALDAIDAGGKAARAALETCCVEYATAIVRQCASGRGMPPPGAYTEEKNIFTALGASGGKGSRKKGQSRVAIPPVKLVRVTWILERAKKLRAAKSDTERMKLAMPRRQQLEMDEPGAFLGVDELQGLKREKNSGEHVTALCPLTAK